MLWSTLIGPGAGSKPDRQLDAPGCREPFGRPEAGAGQSDIYTRDRSATAVDHARRPLQGRPTSRACSRGPRWTARVHPYRRRACRGDRRSAATQSEKADQQHHEAGKERHRNKHDPLIAVPPSRIGHRRNPSSSPGRSGAAYLTVSRRTAHRIMTTTPGSFDRTMYPHPSTGTRTHAPPRHSVTPAQTRALRQFRQHRSDTSRKQDRIAVRSNSSAIMS